MKKCQLINITYIVIIIEFAEIYQNIYKFSKYETIFFLFNFKIFFEIFQ